MTTLGDYRAIPQALTIGQGDSGYDTPAEVYALLNAAGKERGYKKVWQKTCEAQVGYRWGYGALDFPTTLRPFIFALVQDTAVKHGSVELRLSNAVGTTIGIIGRWSTHNLSDPTRTPAADDAQSVITYDRQKCITLPEMGEMVLQDSRLEMWFEAAEAIAIDNANGIFFNVPATMYVP